MAEGTKAADLRSAARRGVVGSNPTPHTRAPWCSWLSMSGFEPGDVGSNPTGAMSREGS